MSNVDDIIKQYTETTNRLTKQLRINSRLSQTFSEQQKIIMKMKKMYNFDNIPLASINKELFRSLTPVIKQQKLINDSLKPIREQMFISNKMQSFLDSQKQYQEMVNKISGSALTLYNVSKLNIPNFNGVISSVAHIQETSKKLQRMLASYRAQFQGEALDDKEKRVKDLSSMGWVICMDESFGYFVNPDVEMQEICTVVKESIRNGLEDNRITDVIKESRWFDEKALDAAMQCFGSQNYYAGVIVLATMIDAALIKIQTPKMTVKKGKGRSVGRGAVKLIQERTPTPDKRNYFDYLMNVSIVTWLDTYFEQTDDFKNITDENRNIYLHGMKDVNTVDEVQFLQLINTIYFLTFVLDDWYVYMKKPIS